VRGWPNGSAVVHGQTLVFAALLSGACGACSAASGAASNGGGADAAPGAPGSDAGVPTSCNTPVDERPDGGVCVLEATGSVVDLQGAPLAGLVMTFCGSICYGWRSDDAGAFVIAVGDYLDTQNYALHADGRPDHAVDYLRMTAGEPRVVKATMRLPTLPPSTVVLPADGAPASSLTAGDLTLSIPDGTSFDLDIEDFGSPTGRVVRIAPVSLADAPPHAIAANVDAIYALAPSGAKAYALDASGAKVPVKMGVVLRNAAALPASAAVELLVLGDDYSSTPPNVGVLSVSAQAHVSADGLTVQTDPGEGISEITWLGMRRKGK
jgi:hypothetical protein